MENNIRNKLKGNRRLVVKVGIVVLVLILGLYFSFNIISTYADSDPRTDPFLAELNDAAKGNIDKPSSYFEETAKKNGDQEKPNGYSDWTKGGGGAYMKVKPEYSLGLYSHQNYEKYPTTWDVGGNTTKKVACTDANDKGTGMHTMDGSDHWVFDLSKGEDNVQLTYKNLYHYNPSDPHAMKEYHPGYVRVDLNVKVVKFTKTLWPAKSRRLTADPMIQFTKSVAGVPSVDIFNVGRVTLKLSSAPVICSTARSSASSLTPTRKRT